MFRCENPECRCVVAVRQPVNTVVVEKRTKTYEVVLSKFKTRKQLRRSKKYNRQGSDYQSRNKNKTFTTTGWEIVKEIKVCPDCYVRLTGEEPKIAQEPVVQKQVEEQPRRNRRNKKFKNKKNFKRVEQRDNSNRRKPVVEVVKPLTK